MSILHFYKARYTYAESALHIFVSCILVVDIPSLAPVGESHHCIELRITLLQGGSRNINWGLSHKVESP